jgi:hypothetical protein
MKRAFAKEGQERADYGAKVNDRFVSTLVVAASIIAAVRLAREEHIGRPTPKVFTAVADAVSLVRMILDKIIR